MAGKKSAKNKATAKDYLKDIEPSDLTIAWEAAGTWHAVHGDGKSSTGGKFKLRTMKTSDGKYKVLLIEDGKEKVTVMFDSEPTKEQIKTKLEGNV